MSSATYEHDCKHCIIAHVGAILPDRSTRGIVKHTVYDLYICPSGHDPRFDSLIARYGEESHEYLSYHPSDIITSAVQGFLQGLWAHQYDVVSAGYGFVTFNSGYTVRFHPGHSGRV